MDRFKHGGRGWKNTMKLKQVVGANVKGEIRPKAQVQILDPNIIDGQMPIISMNYPAY